MHKGQTQICSHASFVMLLEEVWDCYYPLTHLSVWTVPFPPEKVTLSPRHPLAQIHDDKQIFIHTHEKKWNWIWIKCGRRRVGVEKMAERDRKGKAEVEVLQSLLSPLSCQAVRCDITCKHGRVESAKSGRREQMLCLVNYKPSDGWHGTLCDSRLCKSKRQLTPKQRLTAHVSPRSDSGTTSCTVAVNFFIHFHRFKRKENWWNLLKAPAVGQSDSRTVGQ